MKIARVQPVAFEDMNLQLIQLVKAIVFDPVAALARAGGIHVPQLTNAASPKDMENLVYAVRVGQVSYAGGIFSGSFNAAISRALLDSGAKWLPVRGVYSLKDSALPTEVLGAVVVHREQSKQVFDSIYAKLDEVQAGIDQALERHRVNATRTVTETQAGLYASTPAEGIPQLSSESLAQLSRAYQQTISKPIKDWTLAAMERLRRDVQDVAGRGFRAEALAGMLRKNFGESRKHAEFIARQETSLFQSAFRRERFSEAGIRQYMWRVTRDDRVRASHKRLNGKVFFYSQPPITDPKTGARGNPGEPYGCRCADMPVLPGARP